MLTPQLLQSAGFLPDDRPGCLTLQITTEDDVDDGYIADIIVGAGGYFPSDEEIFEGQITVVYDEPDQTLYWRFSSPHTPTKIGYVLKKYHLPKETAYAIRVLNHHIGLNIPIRTIDLGDRFEVTDGHLLINGQAMKVTYPQLDRVVAIEARAKGEEHSLGTLIYDHKGKELRCELFEVVGTDIETSPEGSSDRP